MTNESLAADKRRRTFGWIALFLLSVLAFAWVAVPVWKIQPFSSQTSEALQLSYALRRWSPAATVAALIAALALVVWLWRRSGRQWWRKALLILPLAPLLFVTWFARQNHFEWMFAPLARGDYARAAEVDFVGDDEMVLAVRLNDDAVAFPVRQIAYHHVVQETIGGVPVVATY